MSLTDFDIAALIDRPLDCLVDTAAETLPVHAVRPLALAAWLASLPGAQASFISGSGFTGATGSLVLIPGGDGLAGAVLGLGTESSPHVFGALAGLPAGSVWRLGDGIGDPAAALLGFCLGAYRFDGLKSQPRRGLPRLSTPPGVECRLAIASARAVWLVRDLINLPANLLGPEALAQAACGVMRRASDRAHVNVIAGDAMRCRYPAVHAVAQGSVRAGVVVVVHWRGTAARDDSALVSLCGKGVCFDTGGYDLKSADGMLRMKKDMAGAATSLALARMIIESDLPLRLELRLGCVENAVHGNAMRPLDVLRTRSGMTVEVGNTDAEGRLVLCDLLSEACESRPDLLLDFATLTGAARTALGTDIAAMFCNDDDLASMFCDAGRRVHDPIWRLPLWDGYNSQLESGLADLNNVSGKPYAGAVMAALFLHRFVNAGIRWGHFDVYGWNDQATAGRPQGGEVQALRAAYEVISRIVHKSD